MLEGLEVSETKLSEALSNKDFRLEGEYYVADGFKTDSFYTGEEILQSAQYNSTYGLNDLGKGYPILRMHEFDEIFTGTPSMHYDKLSAEVFEELRLRKNDILICRTNGNPKLIGKSAMAADNYPYLYESHLFKIRVNEELTNAATITTFLNCKYGRREIEKLSMVGNQANFSIAKFKELRLPKFTKAFFSKVETIVFSSFNSLKQSQSTYTQAEQLLLQAIGLNNFKPTTKNTNVKKVSQSYAQSGRLDAEYYLPKYEEVVGKIKSTPYGTLKGLAHIKKSVEPGSAYYSDEGIPFLRVSDYNKLGYNTPELKLNKNFERDFPDFKTLKPKKDTILLSKDGSVGVAYKLDEDLDLITSGAILHLEVKDTKTVLPDYLTLALNSPLTQLQAERDAGGSIILHWRVSEIENVLIPVIDYKIQQQISSLIQQSFALKKQSKELLQKAKLAVEVAIEEGEEKGLKVLK